MIRYFSDGEEAGGPTHFARSLPDELTTYDAEKAPFNPPNLLGQAGRDPAMLERLYADQRPIRFTVGTVALYRLDAWHRGEAPPVLMPMLLPSLIQRTQNISHPAERNLQLLVPGLASQAPRQPSGSIA